MAKFNPGSIISEIRGSVGDVTYSKNHYGPYSKQKLTQTVTNTEYQLIMRNALADAVASYQSMSDSDFITWNEFVNQRIELLSISRKHKLAAFNEYVSRFVNAACLGLSPGSVPVEPPNSEFSYITGVNQSGSSVLLDFQTANASGTNYIAIYASPPLSPGIRSNPESRCNLIGYTLVNGGSEAVDVTEMYNNRYAGLGNGTAQRIFFAIKNINAVSYDSGKKSFYSLVTDGTFPLQFTTEYIAVLTYASSQGYTLPSTPQQIRENTLMQALIDNWGAGVSDIFYNFITDGSPEYSLINWMNPGTFDCSIVGVPTFTPLSGWQGGSSDYLTTNFNPSIDSTVGPINMQAIFIKLESNNQSDLIECGVVDSGGNSITFIPRSVTPGDTAILKMNSTLSISRSNTDASQNLSAGRINTISQRIYLNGSAQTNQIAAQTSIPNGELYLLGYNNNGSFVAGSSNRIQMFSFGINALMTSSLMFPELDAYYNSIP